MKNKLIEKKQNNYDGETTSYAIDLSGEPLFDIDDLPWTYSEGKPIDKVYKTPLNLECQTC